MGLSVKFFGFEWFLVVGLVIGEHEFIVCI